MRLSRTSVLGQLDAPGLAVVLLEAPIGFGKSWLARRGTPPGALRLRATLAGLPPAPLGEALLLDDAHLLAPDEVTQLVELVELVEDAGHGPAAPRLVIAGNLVPPAVHDAVHLVDGLVLDATALAVTPGELFEHLPDVAGAQAELTAQRIVEATDGCIRIVAAVLDQVHHDPATDPVALASRMARNAAAATLHQLSPGEQAVLGLLARAPGLDENLLERLGGPGFVRRSLAAGVPLRRRTTGELDLAMAGAYRTGAVAAEPAADLAAELSQRGRHLEAMNLLLDAGLHGAAVEHLLGLKESITDTIEPRALLAVLARLGSVAERNPGLLLVRAAAMSAIGQLDRAAADIDRAVELAAAGPPPLLRRARVEAARARMVEGDVAGAVGLVQNVLADLEEGEERTYARAHTVLGECAATSDSRGDLQEAAEHFAVAASTWEGCGENARARGIRRHLATSVLIPLGRYDEALAVLHQLLADTDLSDIERVWTMTMEGFALTNANQLRSAEARFDRVTDIGYAQDNARLVAVASWGRAMIAARRDDLDETLRWITTAENTALTEADDVLGITFRCDAATALGALGELDLAERHLGRATQRGPLFQDQIATASFVLAARRGEVGDLDAQLRRTPPAEWWRLHLVTALAFARRGDLDEARRLELEARRELTAFGVSSFDTSGERRTAELLQRLLDEEPAGRSDTDVTATDAVAAPATRRLRVFGAMTITGSSGLPEAVAPGNPCRLVGVVAASGGAASLDQISDAIWPGDGVETTRTRLRNILMRLRRVNGDVLVRTAAGIRLAPDLVCDLQEFERTAADALAVARTDPDLGGRLARRAVALADGTAFAEFQYEEWATTVRRIVEQRLIALYDLLSVQAEDEGDLPAAQAFAELALQHDRYSDSRYVRLSELLVMQHRVAAALAVLDDAADAAREAGGLDPRLVKRRRDELIRDTALG